MSMPGMSPIAHELEEFWQSTQSLISPYWVEANYDMQMFTGQQDAYNNIYGSTGNGQNRHGLQFNKILRIINMVSGYQIDNRLATQLIPADNDVDMGETTDQLNTVLQWAMRRDQTYEKVSDTFANSLVCGLNLLSVWMDYREDPENGELRTERLPFSSFIMDPYWTKPDLSDCTRIWTRKYFNRQQIEDMCPKLAKDLPELTRLGTPYAARDGKFQFMPQNWQQYQFPIYAYDEYWKRSFRTVRKLLDKTTGEVAEWHGNRDQFQLLRRINPNVTLIKARVPTVTLHTLVNNQEIYKEEAPYGLHRFPFVPLCCYHYPEVQSYAYRYQGLVRNIRDSQTYVNRTRNNLFDMMQAQIQSGLMVKEDALVNPEDAFLQGPGRALFFKQQANLATDVVQIPPPPVAAGWMELIQTIEKEIVDIVGPEELFANNLGGKEMSGVFLKLKMGAGLTGLRNVFDKLNQAQMILGEIQTDLILNNFSVGKIRSIIGKEPSAILAEACDPDHQMKALATQFLRYSCSVEEGELTATQRQLQFVQAIQLKQLGIPISNKYLLEKSTLQGKKEIIEDIMQQEQQAQQLQQQQQAAELDQLQMVTRGIEAKAQADFGSSIEHRTRALSNIGLGVEREAQAKHDLAKTALENARAVKELEEMDENRVLKLSQHIMQIQQMQDILAEKDKIAALDLQQSVSDEVSEADQTTKPLSRQIPESPQQQQQGP